MRCCPLGRRRGGGLGAVATSRLQYLRAILSTVRRWTFRLLKVALSFVGCLYFFWLGSLLALRYVNPPTTGVQLQRRVEAIISGKPYHKHERFVSLDEISPNLQHAVIAAEDGNFYRHHGIDWSQVAEVTQESRATGKIPRGASTITQQLIKNLFFTTYRDPVRKAFEYTLTPLTELILGKRRILELYLNEIEWGPAVYGAEAAAEFHYHTTAAKLDREKAARLAAIVPAPRRWKPARMDDYRAVILDRMQAHGW
jgi:monofunctional biosynthetic peptidoglycan transglycosylase